MAATFRVRFLLAASALLWGAGGARAQDASESNTVGPSELQNFNLEGTVTRPATPPPAPAPTPTPRRDPPAATRSPSEAATTPARPAAASQRAAERAPSQRDRAESERTEGDRAGRDPPRTARPSVSAALPPLSDAPIATTIGNAPPPAPTLPPADGPPLGLMLAALAVFAGGAAYWWFGRTRPRTASAGGPSIDEFRAPPQSDAGRSPAPTPTPAPSTPLVSGDNPIGIVSTRLRPRLELELKPLRCVVDGEEIALEIELTLFNSGNLPARSILLEAAILNAGPNQDRDIDYFFMNPVGAGKRASSLPPLKKAVVKSRIVVALKDAQQYEVEGRMVYVPIVAINAIYEWPNGEGQSARAFVVGRETGSDRLGPFRLDRGPGAYEPLTLLPLENGVRA